MNTVLVKCDKMIWTNKLGTKTRLAKIIHSFVYHERNAMSLNCFLCSSKTITKTCSYKHFLQRSHLGRTAERWHFNHIILLDSVVTCFSDIALYCFASVMKSKSVCVVDKAVHGSYTDAGGETFWKSAWCKDHIPLANTFAVQSWTTHAD